jgi:hypothetical protein
VYEVYKTVFEHMVGVLERNSAEEIRTVEANLDALAGQRGIAAVVAKLDAQSARAARSLTDICCAVCEDPCELHPRWGEMLAKNWRPR